MESFNKELRSVIARRIAAATPSEIAALTGQLCASDDLRLSALNRTAAAPTAAVGMVRMGVNGEPLARGDDWVAVYDPRTNLTWPRHHLPKKYNFVDAQKAASEFELLAFDNWRMPSPHQLFSIVDHDFQGPAADPQFFNAEAAGYWTNRVLKSSPSDVACVVGFLNGYVYWNYQGYEYFVRPVRVGQY